MPPAALTAKLFSGRVVTSEVRAFEALEPLFEQEQRYVARAVEKRRREFQAGRHCARRALEMLGAEGVAIPAGEDRAPCWPPGFVGSITHTGKLETAFAAAAVARAAEVQGVGLDAEQTEPLGEELMGHVLTDTERRALDAEPASERALLAKLIFSAKEAFYKCQYPLTLQYLGFHDVEVELDRHSATFRAMLLTASGRFPRSTSFTGRFVLDSELMLTGVEYPFPD